MHGSRGSRSCRATWGNTTRIMHTGPCWTVCRPHSRTTHWVLEAQLLTQRGGILQHQGCSGQCAWALRLNPSRTQMRPLDGGAISQAQFVERCMQLMQSIEASMLGMPKGDFFLFICMIHQSYIFPWKASCSIQHHNESVILLFVGVGTPREGGK